MAAAVAGGRPGGPPRPARIVSVPNNAENTALQLSFGALLQGEPGGARDGRRRDGQQAGAAVKCISVADTCIELTVNRAYPLNRLLLAYPANRFAIISFSRLWLGSGKEAAAYIEKVLAAGVLIDGQRYHYLGQSNSQLQSRTCVLYRCGGPAEAAALLEQWGCFARIDSTAKRAKRIGLLFSTITPIQGLARPIRFKLIEDEEHNGFTFTDGCGFCTQALAKRISRQQGISFRGDPYVPSVLQIRFRGFKGTVQVAALLDGSPYDLLLREESMLKFKEPPPPPQQQQQQQQPQQQQQQFEQGTGSGGRDSSGRDAARSGAVGSNTGSGAGGWGRESASGVLGLVGFSQPYKFGYLNMQTVMLLSGLGVPDDELLRLQADYLQLVAAATCDIQAAFTLLAANNEVEALEHLVEHGITAVVLPTLRRIQSKEMEACRAKQRPSRLLPSGHTLSGDGGAGAGSQQQAAEAGAPQLLADAAADGAAAEAGEESSRVRVLVPKSRLVYGICDPTDDPELLSACREGQSSSAQRRWDAATAAQAALAAAADRPEMLQPLRYGECFFQPTIDGTPCVLTETFVVVVRNPCYHVGDVLVLLAVDKVACRGLRDALVLPRAGRRPHADESSGGDLDGDQFFVSWEPGLIPARTRLKPAPLYPAARSPAASQAGHQQLARYFAAFDNRLLARMNNWYLRWADLEGPGCDQCCALAALFARGVDAVSTGVKDALPERLKPPDSSEDSPEQCTLIASRVWNVLLQRASAALAGHRRSRMELTAASAEAACTLDADSMMGLLGSRDVCVGEYELLRLCAAWCRREGASIRELALFIDFAQMDHLQKRWAIQAGVPPSMVHNALNQSVLLTRDEVAAFQLGEQQLHWKLLCAGDLSDELAFHRIHTGLAAFRRKLLVLRVGQPPASLQTVALYLTQPLLPGEVEELGADCLAFLFAGPLRRKMELLHHRQSLQASLSSTRLQVYWNHNTEQSFLLLADQAQAAGRQGSGQQWGSMEAGGRGRGRGGRGGRGGRSGRGDKDSREGSWQTGPPPTPELMHRPVLASIAVTEFDAQAYKRGSIQQVRKTALHSYELYVVSEARPLLPASLQEAGTQASFWQEAAEDTDTGGSGASSAALQADHGQLAPTMQAATEEDAELIKQAAGAVHRSGGSLLALRPAALEECEALAVRLAGELKMLGVLQLLDQAGAWAELSQATWECSMRGAAHLRCPGPAALLVQRAMESFCPSLPTRLSIVTDLLASTGLMSSCPAVCILVWDALRGSATPGHGGDGTVPGNSPSSSSSGSSGSGGRIKSGGSRAAVPLPAAAAVLLVKAAIASSSEVGAQDLLASMLQQFEKLPRSGVLLQQLLQACVRCYPDRAAALRTLDCLQQHYSPEASSSQLASSFEQAVEAYVAHWGHLLTLDLLAEIQEAEQALQGDAELAAEGLPGAAALYPPASPPAHAPAERTSGDFVPPRLRPSTSAAPPSREQRGGQPGGTGAMSAAPAGGKALLLSSLEAAGERALGKEAPGEPSVEAAGLWGGDSSAPTSAVLRLFRSRGMAFSDRDRLQVGDLVRLSDMRTPTAKAQVPPCCVEGVVVASSIMEVAVELPWLPCEAQGRLWRLHRLCNLTTYERSLEALCMLQAGREAGAACRMVVQSWASGAFMGTDQQTASEHPPLSSLAATACNESQLAAIRAAATRPLTLIHGPPGTGKTHTIAHLLMCLFQQRQPGQGDKPQLPVLVTAGTNVAVDNILRKLLSCMGGSGASEAQPGRLLRVGDAASVGKDLQRYCLEAQEGLRSPHGFDSRRVRKALRSALAVFTTCTGAGSALLAGCRFGTVMVDEASQVTEPCSLVPLMRAPAAGCVLVGDHQQLGPVVTQEGQAQGLHISLFERCSSTVPPVLLDTQYRMHPDIAAFPNRTFYGGRLRSSASAAGSVPPPPLASPVTFIDVPDGRESMGSSKHNTREADAVVGLLSKLLSRHSRHSKHSGSGSGSGSSASRQGSALVASAVGVVTPYRAQAELLRRLTQQSWPELEISTVDAFQGREKEVIVISTVRANGCGRLGFCDSSRRVNVALTRAMRAMVVVGSRDTLCSSTLWRNWIAQATQHA